MSTTKLTNTDRLIKSVENLAKQGVPTLTFMVGRHTGNGPSVIAALRRRGYRVDRTPGYGYRLHAKDPT